MSFLRVRLGIPHKPDGGERDRSLAELRAQLEPLPRNVTIKVFDEVKPNRAWARDMWQWAAYSDAEFFLTLQDDVRVMPTFWPVLFAMLCHLPQNAVLGLAAQDGRITPAMRPWVRSRAWVVGWGYGMWREGVRDLARHDLSGMAPDMTEDSFVNAWAVGAGRDVWHPVPTPAQHRVELASTYGNHRYRAACDWTALPEREWAGLADPAAWAAADPPHLRGMVQNAPTPAVVHHPNVMGSPNWGGSPPPPYVPALERR